MVLFEQNASIRVCMAYYRTESLYHGVYRGASRKSMLLLCRRRLDARSDKQPCTRSLDYMVDCNSVEPSPFPLHVYSWSIEATTDANTHFSKRCMSVVVFFKSLCIKHEGQKRLDVVICYIRCWNAVVRNGRRPTRNFARFHVAIVRCVSSECGFEYHIASVVNFNKRNISNFQLSLATQPGIVHTLACGGDGFAHCVHA